MADEKRTFALVNPMLRNRAGDPISARTSFEAAKKFMTECIKQYLPIQHRKPGSTTPFFITILEINGNKRYPLHFRAEVKRDRKKAERDHLKLERYEIPRNDQTQSITVSRTPPKFVAGGSVKDKKKKDKKKLPSYDYNRVFMPNYAFYWPDIYRNIEYCQYMFSGYYPCTDMCYMYGYPGYWRRWVLV